MLQLLAKGLTSQQIAAERGVSPSTIRTQLHGIYRKLGVVDRAQAVIRAYCEGWLELPVATASREERFLARIATILEQVACRIEKRQKITVRQRQYLQAFDRYLRAETPHVSDEARAQMVDRLDLLMREAGLDPRAPSRQRRLRAPVDR